MSGICGIVSRQGAPVDRALLQVMTRFMSFRGPDAQNLWVDGSIGFGHTLLRTTVEAQGEHQPCSLDGIVWITADARIDGRNDLMNSLRRFGRVIQDDSTDPDLILHAYAIWGSACVKHLIGDFAFAIWDSRMRQLFCARDHFGIKPFFYSMLGQQLVFSNTLNCLRQHPAITSTLNEIAIADFLLFEDNKDPSTTAFADIQRLPSAHTLTWSEGSAPQLQRYWSLPENLDVRYRSSSDYVEHFQFVFDQAVSDRLRSNRIGILMSGGLDSSSVAATAFKVLSNSGHPFHLRAQAVVYDDLIHDQERHFSTLAAKHLGIPIRYVIADNYGLYDLWDKPETCSPEPTHNPRAAMGIDTFQSAEKLSRVFLTGWDGDALISESLRPLLRTLSNKRQYARFAVALIRYAVSQRQLRPSGWGRLQIGHISKATAAAIQDDEYPLWLDPAFEARLNLPDRWQQYRSSVRKEHATRPYAHASYTYLSQTTGFFDIYDAGNTKTSLEFRHPLMDLRLLDFCLSLPLQPWLIKKYILRQAMRGVLPEEVRTRPKTPLAGFPHQALLMRPDCPDFHRFALNQELTRFVNPAKLSFANIGSLSANESWTAMRPLSLQCWLKSVKLNFS